MVYLFQNIIFLENDMILFVMFTYPLIFTMQEMGQCERFRLVFGNFGFMHFLTAFNPLNRRPPAVEQGYRRIVTHNNDYVENGMVYTSEERLNP